MAKNFKERKQRRIERLRKGADRAGKKAAQAHQAADGILRHIPPGQPILVGHHSEKRHRRDLKRADDSIRRSVEAGKREEELNRRADAAEANTAIFSDDPEAVGKLKARLEELENHQARMKQVNAAFRKGDDALAAIGFSKKEIAKMHEEVDNAFSWAKAPFPKSRVANNNANIRRIRERIRRLESQGEAACEEIPFDGGRLVADPGENRVQLFFDAKPDKGKRIALKGDGFHWAPTVGAWQRHYSRWAIQRAKVHAGLPAGEPRAVEAESEAGVEADLEPEVALDDAIIPEPDEAGMEQQWNDEEAPDNASPETDGEAFEETTPEESEPEVPPCDPGDSVETNQPEAQGEDSDFTRVEAIPESPQESLDDSTFAPPAAPEENVDGASRETPDDADESGVGEGGQATNDPVREQDGIEKAVNSESNTIDDTDADTDISPNGSTVPEPPNADRPGEMEFAGGRLVIDPAENWVRLHFDGLPSRKALKTLGDAGFKYQRSEKAWQRDHSAEAVAWAKEHVGLSTGNAPGDDSTPTTVTDAADTAPTAPTTAIGEPGEGEKVCGPCGRCGREADPNNPLRRIVFLDENGHDTDRELDACYSCFGLYVTERGMARAKCTTVGKPVGEPISIIPW